MCPPTDIVNFVHSHRLKPVFVANDVAAVIAIAT